MDIGDDPLALKALLDWQAELGADEPICDSAINRYEETPPVPVAKSSVQPGAFVPAPPSVAPDPAASAQGAAGGADNLDALRAAIDAFEGCDLKRGARNLVFSDGLLGARVMILGEAPGREEDRRGLPFVGPTGQLLDKMLAAIGLSRTSTDPAGAVYIANVLPWRPPQNRAPKPDEIAMMMPFVRRHIQLAAPDVLVLMGNTPCLGVLGRKGVTQIRGSWSDVDGRACLAMLHPAYLMRNTAAKREAWADLLALKARLLKKDAT